MSLVAFGIRIATVRAIQAVVWPEFTVEDSPQAPIDLLDNGAPLIAVFTGQDNDKMDGRDMFGGEPTVVLTIQIFLPPVLKITVAGKQLELDTRGSASETVLDVLSRRIIGALLGQAEPWSQVWFDLVQKTGKTMNSSYLVETAKVRTSAREITIECATIHEPIPGASPSDVWATLVALMRADTAPRSVAPLAPWIAAEITGPVALSQADRDRIDMGLSVYAAQQVGIYGGTVEDLNNDPGAATTIDEVSADPAAPAPDGYAVP
jgi:hypothetical protein